MDTLYRAVKRFDGKRTQCLISEHVGAVDSMHALLAHVRNNPKSDAAINKRTDANGTDAIKQKPAAISSKRV